MMYKIEGLDHYGRGIIRSNKIVFVENALPNELVEIETIKEKKKLIEAKSISIKNENINRIKPDCQYYFECGGCDLLHLKYQSQLDYKEKKVKEIIQKFTKEDFLVKPILHHNQFYYRNKAVFHVKEKCGYYKKKSNDIVPIKKCLLVNNKINHLLSLIENIDLQAINQILIRTSINTEESMIIFKINNKINKEDIINIFKDYVTSIILENNNKYETIYGKSYIIEKLNNFQFMISPSSFFQVNTKAMELLYNKVKEYAVDNKNATLLDLYCGTGTIGIYLSPYFKKTIGIEINESSIEDANQNKEINKLDNIEFICGASSKIINQLTEEFDVIVVDPPRSGLDEITINYLKDSQARKIVYVSCDPVTLARDLNLLKENYDVKEITPVDMFPNTYHVETVLLMTRKVG